MTNHERDEKLKIIVLGLLSWQEIKGDIYNGDIDFPVKISDGKKVVTGYVSQINQLFSEGKDKKRDICVHFDGGTCGNPAIPEVGELTERYCNECAFYEDKEVEEAIEIARTVDNWDFGEPATDIKWAVKTLIDAVERKR